MAMPRRPRYRLHKTFGGALAVVGAVALTFWIRGAMWNDTAIFWGWSNHWLVQFSSHETRLEVLWLDRRNYWTSYFAKDLPRHAVGPEAWGVSAQSKDRWTSWSLDSLHINVMGDRYHGFSILHAPGWVGRVWSNALAIPAPPTDDLAALEYMVYERLNYSLKNGPTATVVSHRFCVSWWLLFVLTGVGSWLCFLLVIRERRRFRRANICRTCGYDVRASTGACPECGEPIGAGWR